MLGNPHLSDLPITLLSITMAYGLTRTSGVLIWKLPKFGRQQTMHPPAANSISNLPTTPKLHPCTIITMAYSPKLQKQPSCSCPVLDVVSWCNSRRRTGQFTRRFDDDGDYYDEEEYGIRDQSVTSLMRWREIWRRIVKEKRRIFDSGAPLHEPYDEFTYAQNFDEGSAWVEPENLSRSFSARFAVPPSTLRRLK